MLDFAGLIPEGGGGGSLEEQDLDRQTARQVPPELQAKRDAERVSMLRTERENLAANGEANPALDQEISFAEAGRDFSGLPPGSSPPASTKTSLDFSRLVREDAKPAPKRARLNFSKLVRDDASTTTSQPAQPEQAGDEFTMLRDSAASAPAPAAAAAPSDLAPGAFNPKENPADALMLEAQAKKANAETLTGPLRPGPTTEAAAQLERDRITAAAAGAQPDIARAHAVAKAVDSYKDSGDWSEQHPIASSVSSGIAQGISSTGDFLWSQAREAQRKIDEGRNPAESDPYFQHPVMRGFSQAAGLAQEGLRRLLPEDDKGAPKRLQWAVDLDDASKLLRPELAKLSFTDAQESGQLMKWLVVQSGLQSPNHAMLLATIVAPGLAPITLPAMAAQSAGNQYAEDIDAKASHDEAYLDSLVNGIVEAGGEGLSTLFGIAGSKAVAKAIRGIPLAQRQATATAITAQALRGAGAAVGTAVAEGVGEGATQVGQDLSQLYFGGRDPGNMVENAKTAAAIGAFMGGVTTAAGGAVRAATAAPTPQERADAAKADAMAKWQAFNTLLRTRPDATPAEIQAAARDLPPLEFTQPEPPRREMDLVPREQQGAPAQADGIDFPAENPVDRAAAVERAIADTTAQQQREAEGVPFTPTEVPRPELALAPADGSVQPAGNELDIRPFLTEEALKRAARLQLVPNPERPAEADFTARAVEKADSMAAAVKIAGELTEQTGVQHRARMVGSDWVVVKEGPEAVAAAPGPEAAAVEVPAISDAGSEATSASSTPVPESSAPAPVATTENPTQNIPENIPKELPPIPWESPGTVDAAAHTAATSPTNALPEPSERQNEAENFKMGHPKIGGLAITIKNPEGSKRFADAAPLTAHYGHIKRTEGADGSQVDVFVKPGTPENFDGPVFVVDQVKRNNHFDEHKVVLGVRTPAEARTLYAENYPPGFKVGRITQMGMPQFRAWVRDPALTKRPAATLAPKDWKAIRMAGMTPAERERLTTVEGEIGWAERGGSMIRAADTGGEKPEVVGRTKWIAGSDFWPGRPEPKISEVAAREAVRRAKAGEPLSVPHQRFVDYALEWLDRKEAEAAAPKERAVERRKDDAQRARVADMTPEEMRRELLTSDVTGLPNRRAFKEASAGAVRISADVDNLKWINDTIGHHAGDALLRSIGNAFRAAKVEGFHLSGDEFTAYFKSEEEAIDGMNRVRAILDDAVLEFTMPDGSVVTKTGVGLSYGLGPDTETAEINLQRDKRDRQDEGHRAPRGEEPPGLRREPAREARGPQGHPPAQVGSQDRRPLFSQATRGTFRQFTQLRGDGHAMALADAMRFTGIRAAPRVEVTTTELPVNVPMGFDPEARRILVNGNVPMTRAQAAQYMVEELLHAVDSTVVNRAISASAPTFGKGGAIREEAQATLVRGDELGRFLIYPLQDVTLTESRIKAELFARLGVVYFGNPGLLKETSPHAYEAYHGVFRVELEPLSGDAVSRKVWGGSSQPNAQVGGELRGNTASPRGPQKGNRGWEADSGLDALRAAIAQGFGGERRGGLVQHGLQRTREEAQPLDLKGETEAEIRAREALEKKTADEKKKREAAPSEKDFTLTGSDRPVDVAEARGQQPLFRRGEPAVEKGSPAATVRGWLSDFIAGSAVPVRVVQSAPQALGAHPKDRGFYVNGTIYVIADNIPDRLTAERTAARHEALHAGVEVIYGRDKGARQKALRELTSKNPRLRAIASKWRIEFGAETQAALERRGRNPEQARAEMLLTSWEEALAYRSEKLGELKGWRQFMAVIQKGLRKAGLGAVADWLETMTDAEAQAAIAEFIGATRKDAAQDRGFDVTPALRHRAMGGMPMFARTTQSQPLDFPGQPAGKVAKNTVSSTPNSPPAAPPAARPPAGATLGAAGWQSPALEGWRETVVRKLQDKHIDTKKVLAAIAGAGRTIVNATDPYLAEELFHGRAAKRVEDFTQKELKPLLAEMSREGISIDDLDHYLHARHAEERNVQVAKVNPQMPDGGSGMTTADARAYLAGVAKRGALDRLAKRVDAINAATRKLLVDYGLEAPATIGAWQSAYKSYVPLQREDMEGMPGVGQGFSVRGPAAKRATGSTRAVVDILANIAMQRERAITRGEKNIVANALLGAATANPNPAFWRVDDPPKKTGIHPTTGLAYQYVDPLYQSSPVVVMARTPNAAGEIDEHAVVFNERDERAKAMAAALKNLDVDQVGEILGAVGKATRWFAAMNTSYNPIFGVKNITRDVQGAVLNLTTTGIAGKEAEVLKHVVPALVGIYIDLRHQRSGTASTSTWANLWNNFQETGGQTGYRDNYATSSERAEALGKELKRTGEGHVMKSLHAVGDWLQDYNNALENSTRLAAYRVALDAGLTAESAASLAKNLTVNFNRRGADTSTIASLYAFFNASVQGTARLAETLAGPKGRQIIAGGVALGVLQALALAAAGFDEDDPPEFVRQKNLVIPVSGQKYVMLPMPLGFNLLPNIGRIATQFALSGFKRPGERVTNLLEVLLDSFNPMGSGTLAQTIAPTVLDPAVAVWENKDWTGRPISRTDANPMSPTPGFTRKKDTTSDMGTWVARAINTISGGTDYTPGLWSPTGDQIDYLTAQVFGGVGREVLKASQTVRAVRADEPLPTYKIPLVGSFYGEANQPTSVPAKYFKAVKETLSHEREVKGMSGAGGDVETYLAKNPEAELVGYARSTQRQLSKLRRAKEELQSSGAPRAEVKEIEDAILEVQQGFIAEFKAIQQSPRSSTGR